VSLTWAEGQQENLRSTRGGGEGVFPLKGIKGGVSFRIPTIQPEGSNGEKGRRGRLASREKLQPGNRWGNLLNTGRGRV